MSTLRSTLCSAATAALLAGPASTAILDFDLVFVITDVGGAPQDLLGQSFGGSLSFDDALLDGDGNADLEGTEFSVVVDFFGQFLTGSNDIDFPVFPELVVVSGAPFSIDFIIDESPFVENPTPIDRPDVFSIEIVTNLLPPAPPLTGSPVVNGALNGPTLMGSAVINGGSAAIPLPAGLPLLMGAGGALAALRLRRRRGARAADGLPGAL